MYLPAGMRLPMSARCESTPRPGTHDSSLFAPGRPASLVLARAELAPSPARSIAGTNLERLREAILVERHRRVEHLHAELALGGNRELDRHLEDVVRLASG